jgi:hypothetical protein
MMALTRLGAGQGLPTGIDIDDDDLISASLARRPGRTRGPRRR